MDETAGPSATTPTASSHAAPEKGAPPEIHTARRTEGWWALALCVAFVALGLVLAAQGKPAGWASIVVFGLGAAVLGAKAMFNDRWRLTVDDDGFEIANPVRSQRVAWRDVEELGVWNMNGGRRLAWRLRRRAEDRRRTLRAHRAMQGWSGVMPSRYGLDPEELRTRMLRRWEAAARQDGSAIRPPHAES